MENNSFKWLSLLTALLIASGGFLIAYLLWGIDTPTDQTQPNEPPENKSLAIQYRADLFPLIFEAEINRLELFEDVAFTCLNDRQFTITGIVSDFEKLTNYLNLSTHEKDQFSEKVPFRIKVDGHIGINEKGNGIFILDQINPSDRLPSASELTEMIKTHTSLNQLIAVPFEELVMNQNGVIFLGELPRSIRIALYTLQPYQKAE